MTVQWPLVSAVVPAYKHESYVKEALQSVYEQDYEAVELIVLDDKSPDRTASVIRDYLDRGEVKDRFRRVVFLENERNLGADRTINRGLHESRGDYINILNSDDLFAPARLSTLLKACGERRAEFAFSRVELFVEGNRTLSPGEIEYLGCIQDGIEFFPTVGYALLRNQCALTSGNFFFTRSVYERVGDFSELKYCHDWDFILRSLLVTEPIFVPEPLYFYRLHPSNSFLQLQSLAERETEAVLRKYFFLCRNRPVTNPLAPSPAWGAFFDSFVRQAQYSHYLAKP
jgi:glycosyltransferase involved in cell wall biosynthesis